MQKNLKTKTIIILAFLVVSIYGIFGIPHGVSGTALKDALLQRINLGLDLKGGTHLILQVMVDEAVSTASDSDMGGIQADLQQNGINGATVSKPDPNRPEVIQITGVPADHVSDVSGILNSRYSTNYDITPGVNNTWTLTMKPTAVTQLKQNALDKAIDVIRQRVDSFGVKEPAIEPYQLGSYQILVELPGIDDLGRIKDVIQSTARLETHEVMGGPWPDKQTALQSIGGTLPPDAELLQSMPGASSPDSTAEWYELKKIPIWGGTDIRDAQPGHNPNTNEPEVDFY